MKKPLLIGASLLLVAMADRASAQLALENFNAGVPASWTMINADNKTIASGLVPRIIAGLGTNAWMPWVNNAAGTDSVLLTSSWFTPAGQADRWLISPSFTVNGANCVFTWKDVQGISGAKENLQIWVSPTASASTSSFTTKLYDAQVGDYQRNGAGYLVLTQRGASLSAYNGQTIRVAIRNNTNAGNGVTMIDDAMTTIIPTTLDASLDKLTFSRVVNKTGGTPVRVTVSNKGAQAITSLQMNYKIDGGTPVTQTFSGLSLQPYGTTTLNFTSQITNPAAGAHTLDVAIVQTNGAADPVTTNNTATFAFSSANNTASRNALIEEFSSSTCGPCEGFNAVFDPLVNKNNGNMAGSKFNVIKYQMNWPDPGTDVSYNAQGLARRNYYGVSGIPDHYTNGAPGGSGNQAEITAAKTPVAFMDMSGTYIIKGDSLISTITITPQFTLSGANFKVHMAGIEHFYDNSVRADKGGGTTGQTDYYHVMRNMLGGGSGLTVSSWTAGTPQTFRWAHKWTVGTVTQMSNIYWKHPIGSASVVAFVQDENDKTIMQSHAIGATWPVGVEEVTSGISQAAVYPNPAINHTSIAFKLENGSNVDIQVTDALGRVVYSVPAQKLAAGNHSMVIPTSNFASGLYSIKVQAENGATTQRFSVAK